MDEERFYATFYCASVTRCYPGKSSSGKGDRTPSVPEQRLCAFWREWELRLIRPELVLAVGGLSAKRLLGVSNFDDCIGRRFALDGAVAIPLPHPSGTSRWLNDPANRERLARAIAVVREELSRLDG
jgi:uracil-DNA glycosylase